jgi:hypothetical protein
MGEGEVKMDNPNIKTMAQFLATEHTAMQNALNATVVESNGRSSSFLTTISASMVALALVAQISKFGEIFLIFSLALLPILGFIGFSAYIRMIQLDFSAYVYTAAINRIRHFYLDVTPELAKYLSFPAADDEAGVQRARVMNTNILWNVISLNSSLILVINGLLAGAFCGLLIAMVFQVDAIVAFVVGVITFLLVSFLLYRLGLKWYEELRDKSQVRFPSLD